MLHWPHSLYNRLVERGMCAATCSVWWLGCCGPNPEAWSFKKQPSWRVATSPEALLAQVQLWCLPQKKKKAPCDSQTKTNTELCTDGGQGFLSIFFSFSLPFLGQPPLTKLQSKQSSVNTGWNKGKHGLLWRVCGEWVTMWGGHSWYWASGAIFFLAGWDVLRGLVPHPGLTCWAMTTKQMAFIAAHGDLWPLGFELPCREGLF